jgi:NADH:ubiquinone oxidoreductase subunit 4 (subunit M)
MNGRGVHRRRDAGGLIFGGILLVVGIYYLLQRTLGLDIPDLNWDQIWPVFVILLGGAILYGAWSRRTET